MSEIQIERNRKRFQRTLAKALRTGAVTKRELAERFVYTVRTIERWADGTHHPTYKVIEQDVMRFVWKRLGSAAA